MNALVLGFFASSWFGWAQEAPPAIWRVPLLAGAVLSLFVAASGAVLAWRTWPGGSALDDPGAWRRYRVIVSAEFGIAALGAAGIAVLGQAGYIAAWVCLIVGVHFWPLARVLKSPSLIVLGVFLACVALAAVVVSRHSGLAPSALTGAGAGTALLSYAIRSAVTSLHPHG